MAECRWYSEGTGVRMVARVRVGVDGLSGCGIVKGLGSGWLLG